MIIIAVCAVVRFQSAPLTILPRTATLSQPIPDALSLDWPSYGQAAVASSTYGVVATRGNASPQPTASTAKLITMLAVLKKKPFNDSSGASITFTQTDVDRYVTYVAGNGSVTPVSVGLTWTQYQAMEAVLLGSANNVADSLAVWAFGSLDAYREYAQRMIEGLGMTHTTVGIDASGYHPTTTSTAADLALLAREVLKEPMLRQIVNTKSVILPGAGLIQNTNRLLGSEVIGMKTGYTPEAGGVFVLAGTQNDGEHAQDVITVVMGAPGTTSSAAQSAAYALYESAKQNFHYQAIIKKGDTIASYNPAWSSATHDAIADNSIGMFVWAGSPPPRVDVSAPVITDSGKAQAKVSVVYGSISQQTTGSMNTSVPSAPWWWRIFGH